MKNKNGVQPKQQKSLKEDYVNRELLAESLGKNLVSKEGVDLLSDLLCDKEALVRSAAINSFRQIGRKKYVSKILPLLNDNSLFVRIDAVECLAELGGKNSMKFLLPYINDRSEVVRMYIGTCLGEIGSRSVIKKIEEVVKNEHSNLAKAGLLHGLYLLGKKERLAEILALLKCKRYRVRCSVANGLANLLCKENKKVIKEALSKALKNEDTIAVKSSLRNTLRLAQRGK